MDTIELTSLLNRPEARTDNGDMRRFLCEKAVMVTGGGGSIGAELCRQIAPCSPRELVVTEICENNAYELQQELSHFAELRVEIASVRDLSRMEELFARYRPQVIFHAAAYKHVPMMEECPGEAVKNNVFGTYNMLMLAEKYRAEKFIFISSDKAVNPSGVMGATKRICEKLLQSRKNVEGTVFASVRFGNVLGSSGSVVPLFLRQIAGGGPITITDKRMTRYFMTIPEAARLVLRAAAMARGAEVYVLDMGEPVRIIELAEKLARMKGREPYADIAIVEIGLRPGEKLREELLIPGSSVVRTSYDDIYIERQPIASRDETDRLIEALRCAIDAGEPKLLRAEIMRAAK